MEQPIKKQSIFGRIRSGIFVSVSACFMLFIFAPLEIYMGNPGEFWYKSPLLLKYCFILFAMFVIGSILVLGLARILGGEKIYVLALALYFSCFLGFYVQGNYLIGNLPRFEGSEIDWSLYRTDQIISAVVWFVIFAVVFLLLHFLRGEKFEKAVSYASIFLFLVLGSTLAVVCVNGMEHEKLDYLSCIKDGEFEMSTDQNFIMLILDAIDEEKFWEVYEQHPEYQDTFDDFTFYNNALAGYPVTERSVSLLLSGEWYTPQETYEDYVQRAFGESEFFEELETEGYHLNVYNDQLPLRRKEIGDKFSSMIYVESYLSDPVLFMKRQVKLVGMKYAPYLIKPYCWFNASQLWGQRALALDHELYSRDNAEFYEELKGNPLTYTEQKQFKLLHLQGAHVPFVYDEELNEVEDADYAMAIAGSLKVASAYLEMLRENDVYDNSVIFVMSDHGLLGEETWKTDGRQHPILFIKGIGEKHGLQISGAPVSYADLAHGAYEQLLAGKQSDEIFSFGEDEERERKFVSYRFRDDYMEEYRWLGYAGDESNMVSTGISYVSK